MNDIISVKICVSDNNYFGPIIADGLFSERVKKIMKESDESMTDEAVEGIFSNATQILNYCPNPKQSGEFKKTGIVIGKVQSGKTSNFIALLSLAFDNGYNLGIVLGGNTTELLSQNVERIKKAFALPTDKLVILHSKDNQSQLEASTIRRFLDNGIKVLIVSLKSPQSKNQQHMTKVSQLFDDTTLSRETTIIIDDEGDQATLNSKVYDNQGKVAETYKVATDIKNKINRHCFISITATPQANILIKTADVLSPDFGTLIYPGKGYCGLSVFHGEEQDVFVKEIPEYEDTTLLEEMGVPHSFKQALASFFVGNAIRKSRGDKGVHSMLIHPSQKKFDHKVVKDKVNNLLKSWRIKVEDLDDISYLKSIKPLLVEAHNNYITDGVSSRDFSEIEKEIANIIRTSSDVLVFNSDEKNARENAELYTTRIYLGGNIMDRGITVKGLAVTYMSRRAKSVSNVDNTEQRARWFGYKNVPKISDYIDVCRVWATASIKKDFAAIRDSDEDMWSSIERNMKNGKKFKELPRIFKLQYDASHKLRLTRPNVQKTEDFSWTEWKSQKFYVDSVIDANHNRTLLEDFVRDKDPITLDFKTINKHNLYQNIDMTDFFEKVLTKFKFCNNETLDVNLFFKLFDIINSNKLNSKIDLMFLRIHNHEERKIESDGSIQQLFRGRDTKQNEQGSYDYNGDRSMCDIHPNTIQVQIHLVKRSKDQNGFYSPSLAIYIPEKYAVNLVRRTNDV